MTLPHRFVPVVAGWSAALLVVCGFARQSLVVFLILGCPQPLNPWHRHTTTKESGR